MTAPAWLEELPALPLTDYTGPIVDRRDGRRGVLVVVRDCDTIVFWPPGTFDGGVLVADLRPDLADPLGFGYALRWLRENAGNIRGRTPPHPMLDEMTLGGYVSDGLLRLLGDGKPGRNVGMRHLYGVTTDADRLALVRAIAEVQS